MKPLALVLLIAAIGGSLAGCGASAPRSDTSAVDTSIVPRSHPSALTTTRNRLADPVHGPVSRPRLVMVSQTPYGMALTDGHGFALYRFTHDTGVASTCYGACADAWPPYLVAGRLARGAADGGSVGTIRRTDRRLQVTYAGHPLYYYVGDRRPGEVLCQGVTEFGGGWYVVAPSGRLIR